MHMSICMSMRTPVQVAKLKADNMDLYKQAGELHDEKSAVSVRLFEAQAQVPSDVPSDVPSNVPSNIPRNVRSNIARNVA